MLYTSITDLSRLLGLLVCLEQTIFQTQEKIISRSSTFNTKGRSTHSVSSSVTLVVKLPLVLIYATLQKILNHQPRSAARYSSNFQTNTKEAVLYSILVVPQKSQSSVQTISLLYSTSMALLPAEGFQTSMVAVSLLWMVKRAAQLHSQDSKRTPLFYVALQPRDSYHPTLELVLSPHFLALPRQSLQVQMIYLVCSTLLEQQQKEQQQHSLVLVDYLQSAAQSKQLLLQKRREILSRFSARVPRDSFRTSMVLVLSLYFLVQRNPELQVPTISLPYSTLLVVVLSSLQLPSLVSHYSLCLEQQNQKFSHSQSNHSVLPR